MPPLACRKALGLRNDFRLLLHRSGRTGSSVCNNTWTSHPPPGSARLPWLLREGKRCRNVRGLCALFHTAKCSVRNLKETNQAIAHAAFVPQTALCCCKLALFIKCIYLAADLLLHMNNWRGKCHLLHWCRTILAAEFPALQSLEQETLSPISPFTEFNFGYVSYLGALPNCWKWQNQMS